MKSPDSVNGEDPRIEVRSLGNEARVSSIYSQASIQTFTRINGQENRNDSQTNSYCG